MDYEQNPADKMRRIANEKIESKDRAALLSLMHSAEGRWFIMRLFERCHLFGGTAFAEDNVNRLLVMEGERRVGLHIQNIITADKELLSEKQKAEREYCETLNELKAMIAAAETKEE